jgi:hypothetical protein
VTPPLLDELKRLDEQKYHVDSDDKQLAHDALAEIEKLTDEIRAIQSALAVDQVRLVTPTLVSVPTPNAWGPAPTANYYLTFYDKATPRQKEAVLRYFIDHCSEAIKAIEKGSKPNPYYLLAIIQTAEIVRQVVSLESSNDPMLEPLSRYAAKLTPESQLQFLSTRRLIDLTVHDMIADDNTLHLDALLCLPSVPSNLFVNYANQKNPQGFHKLVDAIVLAYDANRRRRLNDMLDRQWMSAGGTIVFLDELLSLRESQRSESNTYKGRLTDLIRTMEDRNMLPKCRDAKPETITMAPNASTGLSYDRQIILAWNRKRWSLRILHDERQIRLLGTGQPYKPLTSRNSELKDGNEILGEVVDRAGELTVTNRAQTLMKISFPYYEYNSVIDVRLATINLERLKRDTDQWLEDHFSKGPPHSKLRIEATINSMGLIVDLILRGAEKTHANDPARFVGGCSLEPIGDKRLSEGYRIVTLNWVPAEHQLEEVNTYWVVSENGHYKARKTTLTGSATFSASVKGFKDNIVRFLSTDGGNQAMLPQWRPFHFVAKSIGLEAPFLNFVAWAEETFGTTRQFLGYVYAQKISQSLRQWKRVSVFEIMYTNALEFEGWSMHKASRFADAHSKARLGGKWQEVRRGSDEWMALFNLRYEGLQNLRTQAGIFYRLLSGYPTNLKRHTLMNA